MPHAEVPAEAHWLSEMLMRLSTQRFGEFVERWMELPQSVRKYFSHSGAVLALSPEDPVHYISLHDRGVGYFDPTNWIYAQTMQLMCPELMLQVNWNNETKGDIFESIMGMHHELRTSDSPVTEIRPEFERELAGVAGLINCRVYHVYKLHARVEGRLHEYMEWIVNTARWRLDKVPCSLPKADGTFEAIPRLKGIGGSGSLVQICFADDVQ